MRVKERRSKATARLKGKRGKKGRDRVQMLRKRSRQEAKRRKKGK